MLPQGGSRVADNPDAPENESIVSVASGTAWLSKTFRIDSISAAIVQSEGEARRGAT